MRVADQDSFAGLVVFRLFEQRFETPGRAVDHVRLDAPSHQLVR
jgi:hypothetical protein